MSGAPGSLHDFVVVRGRGYRPDQVDAYVDALFRNRDAAWERAARLTVLAREMEEEAERLRETVAQLAPQTYETLGEGARRIFELVEEEAAAVREGVREEARRMREEAQAYADGVREAAQAHADAVGAEADEYARQRLLAARAEAGEIRITAKRALKDRRGEVLGPLRQTRQRTNGLLNDQAKEHAERWADIEREAEEQMAALRASEVERAARAEASVAEAELVLADAEASAKRLNEEARAHGTAVLAEARKRAEEISQETERVLHEHGKMWDEVRTHMDQMRNSLTALTRQASLE